MALHWKLVVDCENAPDLADFWAAALEYVVEDPGPLIEQLLGAGHLRVEDVVDHRGHRLFRGLAGIRHPDDPFDAASGAGHGRRLLFQEVPERKTVKNRLHIDLHGGDGDLEARVSRLEGLGATRLGEFDQGPAGHWWIMQDPEGNEFCVT